MTRAQSAIELLVRERARAHPQAEWLAWQDERFSWAAVLSYAQRAANGWLELGVRPGDRVAILLDNCPADAGVSAAILSEDLRPAFQAARDSCPNLAYTVVVGGARGDGIDWDVERLLSCLLYTSDAADE